MNQKLPETYKSGAWPSVTSGPPTLILSLSEADYARPATEQTSASDVNIQSILTYMVDAQLRPRDDLAERIERSSSVSKSSTQTQTLGCSSKPIIGQQNSSGSVTPTGPQSRDFNGPLGKSYPKAGLPNENAIAARIDADVLAGFTRAALPTDPAARKKIPLWSGLVKYFPDALVAVAAVSKQGSDQHHPGEPMHWDRSKSMDQQDTLLRHLWESGTLDTDGHRHSAKVAWRALAMLQLEIEANK